MRVLVLADIHANLVALEAVLAAAPAHDVVWNLGDTVGYGPAPAACVARLHTLAPAITLAGNHDLAATGSLPLTEFNDIAAAAAVWTYDQLSPTDRAALSAAPGRVDAGAVTLAHGSPRDPIWEYVTSAGEARAALANTPGPLCLVGHSHLPLLGHERSPGGRVELRLAPADETVSIAAGRWLINPGSVGQPRDGDPRAAAALLDLDAATVTWLRVPYNIATTQRAMLAAGLPAALSERLSFGR